MQGFIPHRVFESHPDSHLTIEPIYDRNVIMGSIQKRRRRSPIWTLPTEDFQALVYRSKSIKEVLEFFGISGAGGSYLTFMKRAKEDDIDLSKLPSMNPGELLRGFRRDAISLDKVLTKRSTYDTSQLKRRLITEEVLKNECSICKMGPEWNEKPLLFRLDHINGINDDARLCNLRLVCPNCDSQLDTYCGRNRTKNRRVIKNCKDCGKKLSKHAGERCRSCNSSLPKPTKIEWPSDKDLLAMVEASNKLQVSKTLGISEMALRRRLKQRCGVEPRPYRKV